MRAIWLGLLGVGLLAGTFQAAVLPGEPPARGQPAAAGRTVDGYGETEEAARAVAEGHALALVQELLPKGWQPADDQLRPKYLRDLGVLRDRGPSEKRVVGGEQMVVVRLQVGLTPRYLKEVQRHLTEVQRVARQQRVQERHLLLGRILAGLVIALVVVAGYLRLEEATRGYYTQMLRLAAVALVSLAVLALWLSC